MIPWEMRVSSLGTSAVGFAPGEAVAGWNERSPSVHVLVEFGSGARLRAVCSEASWRLSDADRQSGAGRVGRGRLPVFFVQRGARRWVRAAGGLRGLRVDLRGERVGEDVEGRDAQALQRRE